MLLMDREYALFKMAERLLCQDEICRQRRRRGPTFGETSSRHWGRVWRLDN